MHSSRLLLTLLLGLFSWGLFAQTSLPPRIYGDSLHAPFYHGVASGDPLPNAVIIWTRITPAPADFSSIPVNYQVASDSLFTSIISSGSASTDSSTDWTVKLDIIGLSPNTVYYYRFDDNNGNYSVPGRTRTAPSGIVSDLRFAIFSCSSVYSGYFNSYARVAEKADSLNAAIHLGDYIYDFVDAEEQIRVPSPYPTVPDNLEEWRDRQEYYLLDPDLRAARAKLPWICMWDNHDQDCGGNYTCSFQGGNKAFIEWLPIRIPDSSNYLNIYRKVSFGDLADILVVDALMFRHGDTLANGEYNMLGDDQFSWLTQQLLNSTAKWKLVPQQRMMGGWYTNGIAPWLLDIVPNDGPVFDNGSWDGFPGSKAMLFNFLRINNIDNLIALSGDAHVSIAQDLIENPHDTSMYNPETGFGSVGVEFLPTSVTRGNMDESGAPLGLFTTINNIDRQANPQHQFADLFNHGYGIIHLKPDSSIAQFWYTPKLEVSQQDSIGATLVVKDGENHWSREVGFSSINEANSSPFNLYPNPSHTFLNMVLNKPLLGLFRIEIIDMLGKVVFIQTMSSNSPNEIHQINISGLTNGFYFLRLNDHQIKKFIKN
jgi:alkaline phosphatase D